MDLVNKLVAFAAELEVRGGVMGKAPLDVLNWWIVCQTTADEKTLVDIMSDNGRLLYQKWTDQYDK